MSRPRFCVDIDNVVAQTDAVMRRIISEYTEGRVELGYKDVLEFDYHKCKDANGNSISREEWNAIHLLFSEPRNLKLIQPIPDAQECLTQLADKYEIHLATSRLPMARRATVEWLDTFGFPSHGL